MTGFNWLTVVLVTALTLWCDAVWAQPTSSAPATPVGDFVEPIQAAHGLPAWRARQAIQADIKVEFGDQVVLAGTLLFETWVGRVRIERTDGAVLVFDGQDAWVWPADAKADAARFDLLTWPYFVAAPMKLADPGTHITQLDPMPLRDNEILPAARLTFDSGVGDSPDDWYVLYRDPRNGHLVAMAYIVTYGGKDLQEAQKEPHAITYGDFETIDGVTISTRWQFWLWDANKGIHGEPLGRAQLSRVRFVDRPDPSSFGKPCGAKLAPLPGK